MRQKKMAKSDDDMAGEGGGELAASDDADLAGVDPGPVPIPDAPLGAPSAWAALAGDEDDDDVDFDEGACPEEEGATDDEGEDRLAAFDMFFGDLLDEGPIAAGADVGPGVAHEDAAAPGVPAPDLADMACDGGPHDDEADVDAVAEAVAVEVVVGGGPAGPAAAAAAHPLEKNKADEVVAVAGGVIRFYKKTKRFTAECACHSDPKCILTRASESKLIGAKGRPLGLFVAWLKMAHDSPAMSREEHWEKFLWPDHAARLEARMYLRNHVAGGARLEAECERPRREGEGEEPEGFA